MDPSQTKKESTVVSGILMILLIVLIIAGAAALAALLTFGWERPLRRLGEALFLNEGKHGKRKASGKT